MKKSYKQLLLFVLALNITCLSAQTGIYTFNSDNEALFNMQLISFKQDQDGQLYLLNMCSDINYGINSAKIISLNNTYDIAKEWDFNIANLHNLVSIDFKSYNELAVFGNGNLNKQYEPFQINFNLNGAHKSNNNLPKVYSTLISDVIINDNSFLILYSKVGKNKLYNISLHNVDAKTGNIKWLKKISSENNEEADKILKDSEGNYYILGKKYNDEITEFVPIIYKIDINGNELWKKGINVPANFNKQSFYLSESNNIIYICGYTKNPTGFSETKIIKLTADGEEIHSNSVNDFSGNGIIGIDKKSFLIYGSQFIVDQKQVVTKGKYVIINNQLSNTFEKTLDGNDKPDVDLNTNVKTSSDFTFAEKLSNNKIALGGKVYMPANNNSSLKSNATLFMVINPDGSY